ncbi:tetraspanin-14-like [Xenia sp. Carnegie-2017]|uniref:tetraspanin-14-like n=1 Tax=Xenia sp. Carnegie-2017 TaxID=2897299 RepID=UPI001F049FC1|nr:tetraspanin-14-like [Xenia sp. Carnegie-2017]
MTLRRVQVSPRTNDERRRQATRNTNSEHSVNKLRTSRCVKYTMFFENMFFLLCGAFISTIGIIALQEKGKLKGQFNGILLDPAVIILTTGIIVFVVSFCGSLGALRENKCLLRFFYSSIMLLIIIQLALGLTAYFARDKVKSKVNDIFQEAIKKYQDDPDLKALMDYIQSELKCCGSNQPINWNLNPYYNCSSNTK